MLVAEFQRGKPRVVAWGYPRDWLQALAQDLSARIGSSTTSVRAPQVEVVEATAPGTEFADVAERPTDSRVSLESRANGLVLTVPPAGVWKGSKGLLAFGIFWCLFMTVFTGFSVFTQTDSTSDVPLIFGNLQQLRRALGFAHRCVAALDTPRQPHGITREGPPRTDWLCRRE